MNTTATSSTTAVITQTNKVKETKGKREKRGSALVPIIQEIKPQRDKNGLFLPGNQLSVGNSATHCSYCENRAKINSKINLYIEQCQGNVDGKLKMPYLEELCMILGIHVDTITDWMNPNVNHDHECSELVRAYKTIKMLQKLRLLQTTLTTTPTGAIFQLKANHGMVETEKTLIAGVNNEPMKYEIAIIAKKQREELE